MRDWKSLVQERLRAEDADALAASDSVDEIAHHLADVYNAQLRKGLAEATAVAVVEEELQSMAPLTKAIARRDRRRPASTAPPIEHRGVPSIGADFRHGVRLFASRPGYTALVVVTLALGIGACTSVFSLVNALLLSPLPFPAAERLVLLWESDADDFSDTYIVAAPNYEDWVRETTSFETTGIWEYVTEPRH